MMDYEKWYELSGAEIEESIKAWIKKAPDEIDTEDIFGGDTDAYIEDELQTQYSNYIDKLGDAAYELHQEQELLEGHGF